MPERIPLSQLAAGPHRGLAKSAFALELLGGEAGVNDDLIGSTPDAEDPDPLPAHSRLLATRGSAQPVKALVVFSAKPKHLARELLVERVLATRVEKKPILFVVDVDIAIVVRALAGP